MDRRIRIVMVANSLGINGISSVIINYARALNLEKYDLTIMAGSPIAEMYNREAANLGFRIIELPSRKESSVRYYWSLYKALNEDKFDIFHVHGNSSSMAIELFFAKQARIKTRIAHSHNTRCDFKLHTLFLPVFHSLYTDAFACGTDAGRWLFGSNPFYVMRNGFDVDKFEFSEEKRVRTRTQLDIQNRYVIGHVGRINYQKNQEFLIDVFDETAKKREDAVLLIIGTGPEETKIKNRIENSEYKDRIILVGETDQPELMYMAMDLMVFPSRYEGLPVTLLEAQISGLPCLVSDKVTKEVCFSDDIRSLPLELGPKAWAEVVSKSEEHADRAADYEKYIDSIKKYDIQICARELESKYSSLLEKN